MDEPADDASTGHHRGWHRAPAELDPDEFERFVAELLGAAAVGVDDLEIQVQDRIRGVDGEYVFDATVRYSFMGLRFLVLVEAKRHRNPIKRELVQVLSDKVRSVGAHKGVLVSTAPFQRGALVYAAAHGIALVTVSRGELAYEVRGGDSLLLDGGLGTAGPGRLDAHLYAQDGSTITCTLLTSGTGHAPRILDPARPAGGPDVG